MTDCGAWDKYEFSFLTGRQRKEILCMYVTQNELSIHGNIKYTKTYKLEILLLVQ